MFDINVWPLLETYAGDSQMLAFEGPVLPDLYDDLEIKWTLRFSLTLIAIEDGVEAVVENLSCLAVYEWTEHDVLIPQFDRMFKTVYDPLAPDDVGTIDMKHATIDLAKVIREEILIAIL